MDLEPIYDEESPVPFTPNLSSEFESRLDRITDQAIQYFERSEKIIEKEIEKIESRSGDEPSEESVRYLAVLQVLLDLIEVGYGLGRDSETLVVYPPDTEKKRESPEKYKRYERQSLIKEQEAQFQEQSIREFIRKMEESERHDGSVISIKSLIADGDELHSDLVQARGETREETIESLQETIQPYLQLADKGTIDEHTGYELHDIWRYFRYTWLTPYNTVPGRNINFLIRDAAREHHPVMGIASLASSMMNLTDRDLYIGWTVEAIEQRLEKRTRTVSWEELLPKDERSYEGETRTRTQVKELETDAEWNERVEELCTRIRPAITNKIDERIENIRYDDFIDLYDALDESAFVDPTEEVFSILEEIEGKCRYILKGKPELTDDSRFDPSKYGLSESDLEDIPWEDTDPDSLDTWAKKSETALYTRKRAENLQKLLRDKKYLRNHEELDDREFIEQLMESKRGRQVLRTGLREIKKERVGAGMMNIQVCGAIPPYNELLGGKLTAMTLTGPETINYYRSKYEGYTSKIASAMRGEPVKKLNELVLLDTTSLFATGSAQYDRIRVPTPDGKIEYEEVGKTSGYGSVQFGIDTRQRLAQVTKIEEGEQMVRGRFGEGIAPRMRKIRRGLENLGLNGELLKHESPRIVYVVPLAENASAYLRGETDDPAYFWPFEDTESEQASIYEYWRERWASKRVHNEEVMSRIKAFDAEEDLLLGPQIDYQQRQLKEFL